MKKRRLVIAAFLLLAVVFVGVGFAETATQLNINGTASTSATNINVYFSNGRITSKPDYVTATPGVAGENVKAITLTVSGLQKINDTVIATYTITNASDYHVDVEVPTVTVSGDDAAQFTVTTDFGDAKKCLEPNGQEGNTIDVVVTVKLLKTPDSIEGYNCSFTINFHATGT